MELLGNTKLPGGERSSISAGNSSVDVDKYLAFDVYHFFLLL